MNFLLLALNLFSGFRSQTLTIRRINGLVSHSTSLAHASIAQSRGIGHCGGIVKVIVLVKVAVVVEILIS